MEKILYGLLFALILGALVFCLKDIFFLFQIIYRTISDWWWLINVKVDEDPFMNLSKAGLYCKYCGKKITKTKAWKFWFSKLFRGELKTLFPFEPVFASAQMLSERLLYHYKHTHPEVLTVKQLNRNADAWFPFVDYVKRAPKHKSWYYKMALRKIK